MADQPSIQLPLMRPQPSPLEIATGLSPIQFHMGCMRMREEAERLKREADSRERHLQRRKAKKAEKVKQARKAMKAQKAKHAMKARKAQKAKTAMKAMKAMKA